MTTDTLTLPVNAAGYRTGKAHNVPVQDMMPWYWIENGDEHFIVQPGAVTKTAHYSRTERNKPSTAKTMQQRFTDHVHFRVEDLTPGVRVCISQRHDGTGPLVKDEIETLPGGGFWLTAFVHDDGTAQPDKRVKLWFFATSAKYKRSYFPKTKTKPTRLKYELEGQEPINITINNPESFNPVRLQYGPYLQSIDKNARAHIVYPKGAK